MVRVKICGITNIEDALLASSYGADALGFIFAKKSPRCIKKDKARQILKSLSPFIITVGVFVDEPRENVLALASELNLDALQFHGKEPPSYCHFFKQKNYRVIKTMFASHMPFTKTLPQYKVDAFLFDILYEQKLEGVKTLSSDALKEIKSLIKEGRRVIVSGGLKVSNIDKIIKMKPYAVDVASGIEKLVGKKDERAMELFIKKVK